MIADRARLLVVDDQPDVVYSLRRLFENVEYEVMEAHSGEEALTLMRGKTPDVVLMDVRMPGTDGIATLRQMRKLQPHTPVVLMTAFGSTQNTIEAMKAGAFDFVLKPFDVEKIRSVVQGAAKASQDMRRVVSYQPLLDKEEHEEEIVGRSDAMQDIYKLIGRVSQTDLPVLITGESGTGKELVARAIYHHSRRNDRPFLAINCAAIPDTLLESELFGYHRGSFTGAAAGKPGKFEVCDGGTIFLDEIGEMPIATQGKLLRVLETGEIEKLGSTKATKVDVRVMTATNRDLRDRIQDQQFREDLYYRLRVFEIALPPLRERQEDVAALTEYFVGRYARKLGAGRISVDESAIQKLQRHSFPGNVRELENILKNALVRLGGKAVLRSDDIDIDGVEMPPQEVMAIAGDEVFDQLFAALEKRQPLPAGLDAFDVIERELIVRALARVNGNQSQAARFLGITRNTLRKRIQKYGLRIEHSVSGPED